MYIYGVYFYQKFANIYKHFLIASSFPLPNQKLYDTKIIWCRLYKTSGCSSYFLFKST
jgi:hypothetical protein